jgi:hypothetical protein
MKMQGAWGKERRAERGWAKSRTKFRFVILFQIEQGTWSEEKMGSSNSMNKVGSKQYAVCRRGGELGQKCRAELYSAVCTNTNSPP